MSFSQSQLEQLLHSSSSSRNIPLEVKKNQATATCQYAVTTTATTPSPQITSSVVEPPRHVNAQETIIFENRLQSFYIICITKVKSKSQESIKS